MASDPDPYRVLELSRGASLDEVKRAYRRLAKANHPDAAGEAALPRFLAIQAAYEQLASGTGAAVRGRRTAPSARPSWAADPDRSDATRRAYGGRARTAPPGAGSAPPGSAGGQGAAGGATGSAGSARSRSGAGATPGGPTSARSSRRRRDTSSDGSGTPPPDPKRGSRSTRKNKATLGSTSYDGVDAGEFEPDWRGASWYGTTSGTYWTLNPKEYADPRKHGPEYQARARRAARPGSRAAPTTAAGPASPAQDGDEPAGRPTHTTSSWWESTAGATGWAGASDAGPAASPQPAAARPVSGPSAAADPGLDFGRAAANLGQWLTDERAGGMAGRIVRAILGWLPIAIAIGWSVGEVTGCGRFAATCDGSAEPFVLGLQVVALAILLLVPGLALVTTIAALVMFAAAILGALTLSSTGEAADLDARAATLGAILVVAWVVGLAIAVVQRARAAPSPTSPVS